VFANLLSNATKFSDMGANIDVEATVGADTVFVTVRDSGIGLREDQIVTVFDMFAQADNSLERTRSGLGIGLTLARRLVEMHGGTLTAASVGLGRGSEFTVSLPIVAVDTGAVPEVPDAMPLRSTQNELRVLVVDDNKDSADMLALSLKMMGHEVVSLYDPLQVVETALGYRPDLAFMDVGMPVLNGLELARQLRAQQWPGNRRPRLVALTGWGQEEDRHLSAQAGFDEHLVKPANLETIERVCRETIASLGATRATAS
jgi:CheY-like chemotaxis protein